MLVSLVAVVLSAAGLFVALTAVGTPIWGFFGFMVVAMLGGLFGVGLALGKPAFGFGMGYLVVAGTVGVAALFGWLDARTNLAGTRFGGQVLLGWLAAMGGTSVLLATVAAADVLRRSARSRVLAVKAAGVIAILAVGAVGFRLLTSPSMTTWNLLTPWTGAMEVVRLAVLLFGGIAAIALISAGGHLAIRAFEVAAEDETASEGRSAA